VIDATAAGVPAGGAMRHLGAVVSVGLGLVLLAFATTIDFPKTAQGFKGDEATYYSLAHSLARDFDFTFERKDLIRVWEEFPGPEGIFLKRGKTAEIRGSRIFPYVRRVKRDDPVRTRLYYSKAFIYPLVAAPFVFFAGTNGFLILHALLLSLDLFVAYLFITARGSPPLAAAAYAVAFLLASVVPVYFVWITPELFNFSVALWALFLWSYKETADGSGVGSLARYLRGPRSDYLAAALIGVLTFSKPTHAIVMIPLGLLILARRQWGRLTGVVLAWTLVTGGLFLANAAITGEFNYQGGDRKTFYSYLGFPFANERETFDNIGPPQRLEAVLPGRVLMTRHSLAVFRHNVRYFVFGRSSGLLPYFFPGVLSAILFLLAGPRKPWQWLAGATIVGATVMLLVLTPFTYSGGGGPVGNRYFLSFYPLFLLLTPALAGVRGATVALAVGALFTAKILLNPFYASFHPGEHLKSGAQRWLPLELTLLQDLPMAANPDRSKRPLGGTPPVLAYFPDDNAYNPEGDSFWVKGKSRAEIILRAPVVDAGSGQFVTKAIRRLGVEIHNGGLPDRVTVSTGRESRTLEMKPQEIAVLQLAVEDGVPYHRIEQPTSFVYTVSIRTTSGFVPFLETPGSSDSRFLGALVRLVPEYVDAEVSNWTVHPGED
jgi:hypothetical protein